jgi:hypothetical protein
VAGETAAVANVAGAGAEVEVEAEAAQPVIMNLIAPMVDPIASCVMMNLIAPMVDLLPRAS